MQNTCFMSLSGDFIIWGKYLVFRALVISQSYLVTVHYPCDILRHTIPSYFHLDLASQLSNNSDIFGNLLFCTPIWTVAVTTINSDLVLDLFSILLLFAGCLAPKKICFSAINQNTKSSFPTFFHSEPGQWAMRRSFAHILKVAWPTSYSSQIFTTQSFFCF